MKGLTAKPPVPHRPDGFALSPIRAVFLDSIGRVAETGSEAVRMIFTSVPASRQRGTSGFDEASIPLARPPSSGFSTPDDFFQAIVLFRKAYVTGGGTTIVTGSAFLLGRFLP
jgi:hypothetical protein